jgi:hypothetical protein
MRYLNRLFVALPFLLMLSVPAAAEQRIITYAQYATAARQGYWIVTSTVPVPGRGIWVLCFDISVGVGYGGRPDYVVVEMGPGKWAWQSCANARRTVPYYARVSPEGPPQRVQGPSARPSGSPGASSPPDRNDPWSGLAGPGR